MILELDLLSRRDTTNLAKKLAKLLNNGDIIALHGNLGVGKTYFVQKLCKALGSNDDVSSPSYVIQNIYNGNFTIYHFDLYRLISTDEVLELGLEENFIHGITIIEWPEIAIPLLPRNTWHLYFEYVKDNQRKVKIVNVTKLDKEF